MKCSVHRPANGGCSTCINAAVTTFLDMLLLLGPRSLTQLRALLATVRITFPWFKLDECGSRLERMPDGLWAHRIDAVASRIAVIHISPVPLSTLVPPDEQPLFLGSPFVLRLLDVFELDGVLHVRAKSMHGAYNKATLVRALLHAGSLGMSRSTIAAEYENAYLEIEALVPCTLFATDLHVWHKSAVISRLAGLKEAALAGGLLGV